jgi:RNA polymerase sigma factor (sigma-70 family)
MGGTGVLPAPAPGASAVPSIPPSTPPSTPPSQGPSTGLDQEGAGPLTSPEASYPPAQAGEPWSPPSWEDVVRDHSARVYRLAYRLTGNPHDAEDLTQEVFVRVFRSLSSYTPGTFEGWLHRITTNLFLDLVRRRARIRFDPLPDDAERIPGKEGAGTKSPAQHYDDTHFDDDVQAALDALPPDFRAAVVLCDLEGLSYEEIAATLGIKIGTVRSRIHRGRSQLRAALAHRAPARRPPADAEERA